MDLPQKTVQVIGVLASTSPEIGRWLWALEDTRRQTLRDLEGISQAAIDWLPEEGESSIGAVLYHIAVIEADWLYAEVLEKPFPPQVEALFPYAIRDDQHHLTQVKGLALDDHLQRLGAVHALLLEAFRLMHLADFRRARSFPQYDVSPEWVLYHLLQHEDEHRSQIGSLRARGEARPGGFGSPD